jgi:hypothetical protein
MLNASTLLRVLANLPPGVEVSFETRGSLLRTTVRARAFGVTKTLSRVHLADPMPFAADSVMAAAVVVDSGKVLREVNAWDRAARIIAAGLHDRGFTFGAALHAPKARGLSDPLDEPRLASLEAWCIEHDHDVDDLPEAWGVFDRYHADAPANSIESSMRARHILDAVRDAYDSAEPDEPDLNAVSADERYEADACQRREHDR